MIYPASTFLLASLVVNAASVFGAPIRLPLSSQNVARDVIDDPVLVERTVKVDPVPNTWRSVDPDLDGRTTHSAREIAPENAIRNTAPSDEVEARDPLPEIERIVRRYPRQALYERHETRSPPSSPPVARSLTPETEAPPVERRFFRRALYERHQPRADPPAPSQAREAPPEEIVRRFPRKILAERYLENRSPEPAPEPALPPVVPELPVAREAEPEPELPKDRMVRRYARRAIAEQMEQLEARQDPPTPPAPASSEIPSGAPTLIPAPSSAVPSSSAPTSTATPLVPPTKDDNPVVAIINGPNKAANFVTPIPTGAVEIDRENEETVYHKKTTEHISQCNNQVTNNNGGQPVVPVPVASGVSSSAPIPSATTPVVPVVPGQPSVVPVAPGQPTVTPVVPAQGNTGTTPPSASDSKPPTGTEGATPSASASALPVVPASGGVTDPLLNPAPAQAQPSPAVTDTPTVSNPPPAEGGVTRRDGSDVTDPIVLRGRSSGSVWASYLKRSMKDN